MLTYAHVCSRILTNAQVCWRMQVGAASKDKRLLHHRVVVLEKKYADAEAACQVPPPPKITCFTNALLVQKYKY
jgi:hypothetical protein